MSKQTHFIGIGGVGMSGIALIMLCRGENVSGSDLKESRAILELKKLGAKIFIGHSASHIQGADTVVYSSAIKEDNPEIRQAKLEGIPLIKRAEALAKLMQDKTVVTVSGSHGKTTITSLVSLLLSQAGLSPTAAIGGILRNMGSNACLGKGEFFVAEADESDGSFLYYEPQYSIITNIDYEHLDYYRDFPREVEAFREFFNRTKQSGCVFYCYDDLHLKNIAREFKGKNISFGRDRQADIYPQAIKINGLSSQFDGYFKNKFVAKFQLNLGGEHNISNALSVIALGLELDISLNIIKKALEEYKGAGRRIEIKLKNKDYLIIDDYAHHPTEIKATLSALRNVAVGRIIAIFQPHRYSRTKLLLDEFSKSFAFADYVIVTDIYAAGEPPLEGVSAKNLYHKLKERSPKKEVYFLPKQDLVGHILKIIKPKDLVVTLGAGDIVNVCDELVQGLKS